MKIAKIILSILVYTIIVLIGIILLIIKIPKSLIDLILNKKGLGKTQNNSSVLPSCQILQTENQFRQIDLYEVFPHGGPTASAFLFNNGVLIPEGGNDVVGFSPDKRYFITVQPAKEDKDYKLIIYDQIDRIYYSGVARNIPNYRTEDFWHQSTIKVAIEPLLAFLTPQPFSNIQDIYLPEAEYIAYQESCKLDKALHQQLIPPSQSDVDLQFVVKIPQELQKFDYPLAALTNQIRGELIVNGQSSHIFLAIPKYRENRFPLIWREDGNAFGCWAYPQVYDQTYDYEKNKRLYLWDTCKKWQQITLRLNHSDVYNLGINTYIPGLYKLTKEYIIHQHELYIPHVLRKLFEKYQQNHNLLLREETVYHAISIQNPKHEMLFSQPLKTQQQLHWTALKDSPLNTFGQYYSNLQYSACKIGDWQLPGEWLFNHKISEDGNRIALVQYSESPYFHYKIAIIDIENKTLSWLDQSYFLPVLIHFSNNTLIFQYLAGYYQSNDILHNIEQREKNVPPDVIPPKDNSLIRNFFSNNFNPNYQAYYKLVKAVQVNNQWQQTILLEPDK